MKVKQQTLKGFEFEIDSDEAFEEYYTKNAPLLNGHLLILSGEVTPKIRSLLDARSVAYIDANEKNIITRKKKSTAVLEEPPVEMFSNQVSEKGAPPLEKTRVYHRPIRSGEAITSEVDLVFFSRINSGATIESSRSIQIFGIIDGLIRSDGEFLILKEIGKGTVVFHGEELDKSQLDGRLKLIQFKDGIVIKDILG